MTEKNPKLHESKYQNEHVQPYSPCIAGQLVLPWFEIEGVVRLSSLVAYFLDGLVSLNMESPR